MNKKDISFSPGENNPNFIRMMKMLKELVYILAFISGINSDVSTINEKPRLFEEIYPEIGYKTAEEAVGEFEHHFKQELKLPLRVPPIEFTHYFGRFNDLKGEINDSLEIAFISENNTKHHYQINIRPVNHKIPIKGKTVYKLKDGSEAIYTKVGGFNLMVFERDGWQYMLAIDKRVSEKVTPEILVGIANSIDYTDER